MKKAEIETKKAYATSPYRGAFLPIVFLTDKGAELFAMKTGKIRRLGTREAATAKPRDGRGSWSQGSIYGYAAIIPERDGGRLPDNASELAAAMTELDPEAEITRMLEGKEPSVPGCGFTVVYSLAQVQHTWEQATEIMHADDEKREREQAERDAIRQRSEAVRLALAAWALPVQCDTARSEIKIDLETAERLVRILNQNRKETASEG